MQKMLLLDTNDCKTVSFIIMEQLRALVVDDETPSREEIGYLLKQAGVDVVASYSSGKEFLGDMKNRDFNVIFLDIQMPDMTGLEVAVKLQSEPDFNVPVVFATAYDEYALKAFEANAMDYILKPISEERLQKTLKNVKRLLKGSMASGKSSHKIEDKDTNALNRITKNLLVAEKNGRVVLVDISSIIYISTEYTGTYIITYKDKLFTHMTLKELENRLSPFSFFRTHRSYLVNFNYVSELVSSLSGTYTLRLKDKDHTEIPVSRIQTRKLKKIFNI